jgi:hypothetical protein
MEEADVASATHQTMMNVSPNVCASPGGSVDLCHECPSPDEYHCFDLRCFVQPSAVITSQMLQSLADNTKSDNKSVSDVIKNAKRFPRNGLQTALPCIDCNRYMAQSKPEVAKQNLNTCMCVPKTPLILGAKKQSMPSYACKDGSVTTPLAKKRKLH